MASEVLIKTDRIIEAKNVVSQLKKETEELRNRVNSIKGSLDWKVASKEAIDDNLKSICNELEKQMQFMDNATTLCASVVNSTDETTNALIAAISKILLTIVGIGAVIGGAISKINQIITTGNGATGTGISGTGTGSTDQVPVSQPISNGSTKNYVNSNVNYNGRDYSNYKVTSSYDPSQVLSQKDPRWNNMMMKNGSNQGCTVTAQAMEYNLKHPDSPITPVDCERTKGDPIAAGNYWNKISKQNISEQEARQLLGQSITSGEPTDIRITNHTVLGIGVRDGADMNNLTNDDFLVIDPADGKVKTLTEACNFVKKGQNPRKIDTSYYMHVSK